ncbi:MAG: Rv2175c family DNA-binding protein [Nocardioidaceae bacterium]
MTQDSSTDHPPPADFEPATDPLGQLVGDWLTIGRAAEKLGLSASRVRQLTRERQLVAVRQPTEREPVIPAECLVEDSIVKGLSGTLTLLADHGFDEAESLEWLFTPDESLPGRPIDALREDRGTEVKRRAQALL